MRKLTRVLRALYCEPWLISPQMHNTLCDIAWAHVDGSAHGSEGRATEYEAKYDDEVKRDGIGDVARDGSTAVISIGGVIGRKFSRFLNSSGVTSVDVLERVVNEAVADNTIDSIVLDVDSPGGTVTGTPEAAETIERAAQEKPVVAFTGGMMASAAYWLSAPADAIFAAPSADIGSIGVYAALLDVSRKLENEGVSVELFKQGKFKAMGFPGVPLTDEQREHIQKGVDDVAGWFKGFVSQNRLSVPADAMEGQTFMGREAVAIGLADQIGTLADAIEYAKSEAAARRE